MTRQQYVESQTEEYKQFGEVTESIVTGISEEWYSEITKNITEFDGTISIAEYDSMTADQKFHFNKHYNLRGNKLLKYN